MKDMIDMECCMEEIDHKLFISIAEILWIEKDRKQIVKIMKELKNYLNQKKEIKTTIQNSILKLILGLNIDSQIIENTVAILQIMFFEEITKKESNETNDNFNKSIFLSADIFSKIENDKWILRTSKSIMEENESNAKFLNFNTDGCNDTNELLFRFIKSFVLKKSDYITTISTYNSLFNFIRGYSEFERWYEFVVKLYFNYVESSSKFLLEEICIDFNNFIRLNSYEKRFKVLISPLYELGFKQKDLLLDFTNKVLFPLIEFYNGDLNPFMDFLFFDERLIKNKTVEEIFQIRCFFLELIFTKSNFNYEQYKNMIKCFIANCYYYFLFEENFDKITITELQKIQLLTLNLLKIIDIPFNKKKKFNDLDFNIKFCNFKNFMELESVKYLCELNQDSIVTLQEMIELFQKIFPFMKLKFVEILKLKYLSKNSFVYKKNLVVIMLFFLNDVNWMRVFDSLNFFINNFIDNEDKSETKKKQLYILFIESLLEKNLFRVVLNLFKENKIDIDVNDLFTIILKKFWISYNNSQDFNVLKGKMSECHSCVSFLDDQKIRDGLSEENVNSIISLKHLLKAVSILENFKINISDAEPLRPLHLINNFFLHHDQLELKKNNPIMDLIFLILDQNKKSYLAFEKLHKLFTYLLLFFQNNKPSSCSRFFFNNVKLLCIEFALIDNNILYAYKEAIDLFEYFQNSKDETNEISEFWSVFYKIGKFKFNSIDNSENMLSDVSFDIINKQNEILTKLIFFLSPLENEKKSSQLILNQLNLINNQLQKYYENLDSKITYVHSKSFSIPNIKKNVSKLTNEILTDSISKKKNAGEKISNFFVAGLDWAVGSNRNL